jgi:hypothetical protein
MIAGRRESTQSVTHGNLAELAFLLEISLALLLPWGKVHHD